MAEIEFPPGVPEEFKEFIRKKINHDEMMLEAARHDVKRFFDELSPDQLQTICALFANIDKKTGLYYQGYCTALLQIKYNLCAGCGQDHDKVFLEGHSLTEPLLFGDEVRTIQDGPMPGIVDGNRVDSCSTCHGDHVINVCEHLPGSHGQYGREACPEPTEVPCCECCCPKWYTDDNLSLHQCGGSWLPLEVENLFVCSDCGERLQK